MNMYQVNLKQSCNGSIMTMKSIAGKLFGNSNSAWRKINNRQFIAYAEDIVGEDHRVSLIREKHLNFIIRANQVVNFDLLCDIRRHVNQSGKHTSVCNDDDQKKWILKKMQDIGFSISDIHVSTTAWNADPKKNIKMKPCQAIGKLVADRDISSDEIAKRIGHGGAYGLGMLLVS